MIKDSLEKDLILVLFASKISFASKKYYLHDKCCCVKWVHDSDKTVLLKEKIDNCTYLEKLLATYVDQLLFILKFYPDLLFPQRFSGLIATLCCKL